MTTTTVVDVQGFSSVETFEEYTGRLNTFKTRLIDVNTESSALVKTAIYNSVVFASTQDNDNHISAANAKESIKFINALFQLFISVEHDGLAYDLINTANLCGCFVMPVTTQSQKDSTGKRIHVALPKSEWHLTLDKNSFVDHVKRNNPEATKREKNESGEWVKVSAYDIAAYNKDKSIFNAVQGMVFGAENINVWRSFGKYYEAYTKGKLSLTASGLSIEKSATKKAADDAAADKRAKTASVNRVKAAAEKGDTAAIDTVTDLLGALTEALAANPIAEDNQLALVRGILGKLKGVVNDTIIDTLESALVIPETEETEA